MCLILIKQPDNVLPPGLFKNVFKRNHDGFGFMLPDPETGNIISKKIVTDKWEDCYALYEPYKDYKCKIVLHWRMKTSGKIDEFNAHPHEVLPNKCYFVHNGSFTGYGNSECSDTVEINNKFFKPLLRIAKDDPSFITTKEGYDILEPALTTRGQNRVVIMTQDGISLFGQFEKCGDAYIPQFEGLVFSNQYAWDNQYYYKTASLNEFNEDCGLEKNGRASIKTYDDTGYIPDYLARARGHHHYSGYQGKYYGKPADGQKEETKEKENKVVKLSAKERRRLADQDRNDRAVSGPSTILNLPRRSKELKQKTLHLPKNVQEETNKETAKDTPNTTTSLPILLVKRVSEESNSEETVDIVDVQETGSTGVSQPLTVQASEKATLVAGPTTLQ